MASPVPFVLVVGFHHQLGPQVDYAYPSFPLLPESARSTVPNASPYRLPEAWRFLPFLALPDGAHNADDDTTYFVLPPSEDAELPWPTPLYGVACYRQIDSASLAVKTPDILRNRVQKAVVALSPLPAFGLIRSLLEPATAVYFEQLDFAKTDVIGACHLALNERLRAGISSDDLLIGTQPHILFEHLGDRALLLLKLVLLQRRVLVYGGAANRLCAAIVGLLSLLPGVLLSLVPAPYRELVQAGEPSDAAEAGFPLALFDQASRPVHPYMSLLQLDWLAAAGSSWLVGASNRVFVDQRRRLDADALVDLDAGTLDIGDLTFAGALRYTPSDQAFAQSLAHAVHPREPPSDPFTPPIVLRKPEEANLDDWLRQQVAHYLVSLVSTVATVDDAIARASARAAAAGGDPAKRASIAAEEKRIAALHLDDFQYKWLARWRRTPAFQEWQARYKAGALAAFDFAAHAGHPTHVDDLPSRLLTMGREQVAQGTETVGKAVDSVRRSLASSTVLADARRWWDRAATAVSAAATSAARSLENAIVQADGEEKEEEEEEEVDAAAGSSAHGSARSAEAANGDAAAAASAPAPPS